jgi:hypothetical protein
MLVLHSFIDPHRDRFTQTLPVSQRRGSGFQQVTGADARLLLATGPIGSEQINVLEYPHQLTHQLHVGVS